VIFIMPLSMAPTGVQNIVKRILGKDETRRFLNNLGFVEGSKVCIVSEINGNLIINVKDTRIAVSKEMANRIMV